MEREELVRICEAAVVDHQQWGDRDTASAQKGVGKAWAYLKAGCPFQVLTTGSLVTNERTIWLEIIYDGFSTFEGDGKESCTVYLPTWARLKETEGHDWY